ncbi:hypothetical protein [Lacibacter sp.]|uniref:hypothetical protein n=1 Tax=Lacibacter sp. TaxID=1915409 RepID=UPI002B4ACD26|nr:hypothetical protein [Lacibacter sp.]HLP35444.1 hypothetical protein [Lacibacter sp.]
MATINKFILVTLICNLLIIVGIGHGAAPLVLVEPKFLTETLSGETSFSLFGGYSTRLPACALISLVGQSIMLIALFISRPLKFYLTWLGLSFLYFALLVLTFGFVPGEADILSLLFASPFLYASVRLIVFLIRNRTMLKKETTAANTRF